MLEKQRQELALKQVCCSCAIFFLTINIFLCCRSKGDLHLDPAVERELGSKVMDNLKRELSILMELYQVDGEDKKISSPGHGDKASDESVAPDHHASGLSPDRPKGGISPSRGGEPSSSSAVSFASKIGPHEKNGFAAELLEIITTATSFFNN